MTNRGPLNYQPINLNEPINSNNYTLNLGMPADLEIQKLQVLFKDKSGNQLAIHQESFTN